jgi:hypothetical protein
MPKLRKKAVEIVFSTSSSSLLVPAISSYAADPPAPVGPVPGDRQVEWYHKEQMGFIHFGIDTFYSGQANGSAFIPAETNTSIRPGWFYHPSEDQSIKSIDTL